MCQDLVLSVPKVQQHSLLKKKKTHPLELPLHLQHCYQGNKTIGTVRYVISSILFIEVTTKLVSKTPNTIHQIILFGNILFKPLSFWWCKGKHQTGCHGKCKRTSLLMSYQLKNVNVVYHKVVQALARSPIRFVLKSEHTPVWGL